MFGTKKVNFFNYLTKIIFFFTNLNHFSEEGIANENPMRNNLEKRTYRINLPDDAVPGSFVDITLNDGRTVKVQIPPLIAGSERVIDIVA